MRGLTEPTIWWAALAGFVGVAVGTIPYVLYVLLGMMTLDIFVGVLAAGIAGNINRDRAWTGVLRKIVILAVMAAVMLLQVVLALLLSMGSGTMLGNIPTNVPLTEFVGATFIFYEFVSILENAVKSGIQLPEPLMNMLKAGRERRERERQGAAGKQA